MLIVDEKASLAEHEALVSLAQTLGLAGSEALFIGRHGAGALPPAFIFAAVVTVAVSLAYAGVVGRARNEFPIMIPSLSAR